MSRLAVRGAVTLVPLDGDLVGVRSDADLDNLAGVSQADQDLLPADHDRPANRHPPGDDQRFGQARRLCGAGADAAKPGPGLRRTGQATVRARTPLATTWATGPSSRRVTRCPASGCPALTMRSPRLTLPDAFTVRSTSTTSPDAGGSSGGPAGCALAAAQVAGVEPGRQGLDAVAVEQDVDLGEPGPETDGAACQRGPKPDLLPGDPEAARRRDQPVQLHGPALPVAAGVLPGSGSQTSRAGSRGRDGRPALPGQLGRHPQADCIGSRCEPCCGIGHVQGLVRAPGVVVLAPGVHRGLGVLDICERRVDV
jgi:hypothetical protein